MDKEEVLKSASENKEVVGEMEKTKISKSGWISLVVTGALAIVLVIVEGIMGHISAVYAIASICYTWASVFYFCQYFIARKKWGILVGAILEGLASIAMMVCYILCLCQVI